VTDPKILVIEDDLSTVEELKASFRGQGCEVFTVNWGRDGVRSALAVHPDLVIIEVSLPDIDGFEVASQLRLERRTQDIPIIFLAENRDRADRLRGLELGAEDYITKPFDMEELQLRVRNSLRRVNRGARTHPVSGLPVGGFLDEGLSEYIHKGDCNLLLVSLDNMDGFRDSYGFVAADDVLRAMSVMITNTLREMGSVDDFLGQLSPSEFILVVPSGSLPGLKDRLQARLAQSLDYFYPIKDRELTVKTASRLAVRLADLQSAPGQFADINQLKAGLLSLKR
jgi:DNA-binding response OmpR family regulator